jgi:hypothetical protein
MEFTRPFLRCDWQRVANGAFVSGEIQKTKIIRSLISGGGGMSKRKPDARSRYLYAGVGLIVGAAVGMALGGPLGAAMGAGIGLVLGAAIDAQSDDSGDG